MVACAVYWAASTNNAAGLCPPKAVEKLGRRPITDEQIVKDFEREISRLLSLHARVGAMYEAGPLGQPERGRRMLHPAPGSALQTAIEQSGNTLAAHLGEIEDRLTHSSGEKTQLDEFAFAGAGGKSR